MNRRTFLCSLPLAALASGPARAAPIPLAEIEGWLRALETARAPFTQISADGAVATGTLYIHRPGRMRFEYDPPSAALVIAGGGQVAIFDERSNQPPEQYPLSRTPLSLLLARDLRLATHPMLAGHAAAGAYTRVVATDPEAPQAGMLSLYFAPDPLRLSHWVLTDEAGGETVVELGPMETGLALSSMLFSIVFETQKRTGE